MEDITAAEVVEEDEDDEEDDDDMMHLKPQRIKAEKASAMTREIPMDVLEAAEKLDIERKALELEERAALKRVERKVFAGADEDREAKRMKKTAGVQVGGFNVVSLNGIDSIASHGVAPVLFGDRVKRASEGAAAFFKRGENGKPSAPVAPGKKKLKGKK
ncbi:hypothetical protein BC829DRAFT_380683 [Chytridium lagenaria]|nr:hypothetical protein BC829DRAFT_380683 [Chytridium lagenaria]